MINVLPLTIESLVSILLLLTILYCVRLNSQLRRLKSDETSMQATVAELVGAVDAAQRAIAGLKTTVLDAERSLGESLKLAEHSNAELKRNTAAGSQVLNRLTQIADARPWLLGVEPGTAAAPAIEPKSAAPDPKAIAAAAQAFAERARARSKAFAA